MGDLVKTVLNKLAGCAVLLLFIAWPAFVVYQVWQEHQACYQTYGRACTLWQDAALKSPYKPRPHFNLGHEYVRAGKMDLALQEFQNAVLLSFRPEVKPHEAETARLLGNTNIARIYIELGQIEHAHEMLKTAWLSDPGFPGYAVNLSIFYLKENQPMKAVAFLSDAITQQPAYPWYPDMGKVYLHRGIAYQMLGDCDSALSDYLEARKYPDIRTPTSCP